MNMACGLWPVPREHSQETLPNSGFPGCLCRLRATGYTLLIALLLLAFGVASAQASLSPTQEARAQAIGSTIRCPVCQGLPITESPSELSQSMLRDLREQVVAGRSPDQITSYFAARYGDTVLLDPPRRGVNLLLWLGPVALLLLGGWWLLGYLRRARSAAAAVTPGLEQTGPEADDEPDDYLARVKAEVAHGRPL